MTYTAAELDARVYEYLKNNPPMGVKTLCVGIKRDSYQVNSSLRRLLKGGVVKQVRQPFVDGRGFRRVRTLYTIEELQ